MSFECWRFLLVGVLGVLTELVFLVLFPAVSICGQNRSKPGAVVESVQKSLGSGILCVVYISEWYIMLM